MSTLNGFGTQYYGWRRPSGDEQDVAEATLWVVAAFLPIVPLRRVRLRVVPTVASRPSFFTVGWQGFTVHTQELERLPFDVASTLKTYACGYLLTPVLLLLPILVLALAGLVYEKVGGPGSVRRMPRGIQVAFGIAGVAYWVVLLAKILDRSAGRHLIGTRLR